MIETDAPHPVQPLITDVQGVTRFKANAIVRYLLDNGPFDLNDLASNEDFSREDREQFAQLIGYSLGGFSELSYVSDAAYARAQAPVMPADKMDPVTLYAENQALRGRLERILEAVDASGKDENGEPW